MQMVIEGDLQFVDSEGIFGHKIYFLSSRAWQHKKYFSFFTDNLWIFMKLLKYPNIPQDSTEDFR